MRVTVDRRASATVTRCAPSPRLRCSAATSYGNAVVLLDPVPAELRGLRRAAPRRTARSGRSRSRGELTAMTTDSSPTDWLADYDIFDPGFVRDPYPTMSEIRESACPIAHTERWGGSWMPTRYDDIVAVAQEHDIFTSRNIIVVPPPHRRRSKARTPGLPRRRSPRIRPSTTGIVARSCRRSRRRRSPSTRTAPGRCAIADRRVHRRRAGRRRGRLRPADPRAGHRHDARRAAGDGRRVHVVGARRAGDRA